MNGEPLVSRKAPTATLSETLFASAQVRSAIGSALRKRGIRHPDVDDLTQEVLVKALGLREPPSTLPECIALARKMAGDLAVDRIRWLDRRGRIETPLLQAPDHQPATRVPGADIPEAIDRQRQVDFVQRALDAQEITASQAAILDAELDDVPQEETARRLRIDYQVMRNQLTRLRSRMRTSWAAYASAGLAALVALLAGVLRDRSRPTLLATDVPEPHVDHPIVAPEPTPQETADALRRIALHACDVNDWAECLSTFDRAAGLDPAGDAKPWVQKARLEAIRHVDEK